MLECLKCFPSHSTSNLKFHCHHLQNICKTLLLCTTSLDTSAPSKMTAIGFLTNLAFPAYCPPRSLSDLSKMQARSSLSSARNPPMALQLTFSKSFTLVCKNSTDLNPRYPLAFPVTPPPPPQAYYAPASLALLWLLPYPRHTLASGPLYS